MLKINVFITNNYKLERRGAKVKIAVRHSSTLTVAQVTKTYLLIFLNIFYEQSFSDFFLG